MASAGLDSLWHALSCGVLVHGECGRVVDANAAAARLLGLSRAQLLGDAPLDPDWRALEGRRHDLRSEPPLARLAEACPRRFLVQVDGRDGVGRQLRGDSTFVAGADGAPAVVCTLVDVTEERDEATLAGRRLERLHALRSAAMAMNASHDLRLILHVIVQQAAMHLEVSAAAVALLDVRSGILQYAAGVGFRRSGIMRSRLALGQGYLGRAGLERRSLSISDLPRADDFARTDLLEGEDFVAYFAAPLVSRNRLLGVLELFHRGPLQPDPEWREFMETLADHAAAALDGARMQVELGAVTAMGQAAAPAELTPSQAAILRLLAAGHSNRAVAERVFLSENTVKFHLRHLFRKLGVRSRAAAVAVAMARGWL